MQARTWLIILGVLQLLAVLLNIYGEDFYYVCFVVLPISILATVFLGISIAFQWKRGVEIFIALCIVLLLLNFFPLFSLLFGATWAAWHDILLYIVGVLLEAACIASGIWILYYTDTAEKESLLRRSQSRVSNVFRNSFGRGENAEYEGERV
uniref:Uncharacterized protein n=1 Tax=Guillardia theta TaxID=55529 RepID=A0A7S4N1L8_GUITH